MEPLPPAAVPPTCTEGLTLALLVAPLLPWLPVAPPLLPLQVPWEVSVVPPALVALALLVIWVDLEALVPTPLGALEGPLIHMLGDMVPRSLHVALLLDLPPLLLVLATPSICSSFLKPMNSHVILLIVIVLLF